jgi:hypothetical protein
MSMILFHHTEGRLTLKGHEPVLDISAKVARGVIRSWMKRKHEGYWQSIHG